MTDFKLTPAIKLQQELMQQALDKLFLLEQMIPMIAVWDATRADVVKTELIDNYADIMCELRNNLNTLA